MNPTHHVHHNSAKQKYNVPHAHQLLTHNIALLPFTIDHLGSIGYYQATQVLFRSTLPAASQLPHTTSFCSNQAALDLFNHSIPPLIPTTILTTHRWNLGSPHRQPFGCTYHTFTPTQWAT
jgi:hypothetical protein